MGWLADRTQTRRLPFICGLVTLAGATVMVHLGGSFVTIVVARILQGFSAAVVWIVGLALLADTIPKAKIGRAMGYVYMGLSLGVLLGPLLGGVIFDAAGYDAVFAVAYGIIAIDVLMRLVAIERSTVRRWLPEETLELASLQNQTARDSNSSVAKRAHPMITLLRSKRLLTSLFGTIVKAVLVTSLDAILPLYVKSTFNWTSRGAGLLFLALVVPSFLGPLVGHLTDRLGAKWIATLGFILATPVWTLMRLVTQNTVGQKVLLVALLVLHGLCTNLIITPIMAEITHIVEGKARDGHFGVNGAYAQAYGLFNLAYAIGCMLGPLWAGFVLEQRGWGTVTWTMAVACAGTAVLMALGCGGRRKSD